MASDGGIESTACRTVQARDQGSFCTEYFTSCKKLALVASVTEIFLPYTVESCSNCPNLPKQVRLDPSREGAAELGLNSSFYMGMRVKSVDGGQKKP